MYENEAKMLLIVCLSLKAFFAKNGKGFL